MNRGQVLAIIWAALIITALLVAGILYVDHRESTRYDRYGDHFEEQLRGD